MQKEKKIKLATVLIVILLFILSCVLFYEFARLATINSQKKELQAKYDSLKESIETYSDELDYYQNREQYLSDYAHQVLNWSKDGETVYSAK